MPLDITTENGLFIKSKRRRPENPYQLCTSESQLKTLYLARVEHNRRAYERVLEHFKSPTLSNEKQTFFRHHLPIFAANYPESKEIVRVILSEMAAYKECDRIFDTLLYANQQAAMPLKFAVSTLYVEFNQFSKPVASAAPSAPDEVVLMKEQSLDEILALRLADAEKKGAVIVL